MNERRTRLTRVESQQVTRLRLISAAREIIIREGVGAASVRTISEAAGYSQGAFYSNFPAKEHLLFAVMEDHLTELAGRVEGMAEAVCQTPRPEDTRGIPAQVAGFFRDLNPKPDWSTLAVELQLYANRSTELQAEYAAMREALFQRLGAALARIFDHLGLTPGVSPKELAMGLISTSVGFSIQFGGPFTPEARARFMSAVFEGILSTAHLRKE